MLCCSPFSRLLEVRPTRSEPLGNLSAFPSPFKNLVLPPMPGIVSAGETPHRRPFQRFFKRRRSSRDFRTQGRNQ